ncbi:signal transduction histidine kinase [Catalinimonas alkaloidigena]|uniref:ATP-binding protein n=1 Tax=Catalinimonas alkaloidigena TaxID=1075417 RepID=UPI002406A3F5|nr:tetratricopeptide repeat protein [Catalinimonas alkaloidigena]MDF9798386.1 signal transduction histidine kinase [Catalinimonas alkaloidigena]
MRFLHNYTLLSTWLYFFITYLFFSTQTFAQEHEQADSLWSLLTDLQDTSQVHLRQKLARTYQHNYPDSAMAYGQEALRLSEELNYDKGKADALLHIGVLKRDKGNFTEALEDIFVALDIYQAISDSVQIGNAYNDISIVYGLSNDLATSRDYFHKALDVFRRTGDTQGESYALNNIGAIYEEEGRLEKAKEYYLASMAIKQKRKDLYGISRGYNALGNLSINQKHYEEALNYFFRADSLFIRRNDDIARTHNLKSIAQAYLALDELYLARDHAQQSYAISKRLNNKRSLEISLSTLADICAAQEDFQAAYQYQVLHEEVTDSLHKESEEAYLAELKARFDNEYQKTEIALLKNEKLLQEASIVQQRTMIFSLGVGLLITLAFSIALYKANLDNKQKNKLLAIKNKEIQQQSYELSEQKYDLVKLNQTKDKLFSIISHDIRSPLNTLKGFSGLLTHEVSIMNGHEMQRMSKQINTALDNLSQLLDNLLNWSLMQTGNAKPEFTSVDINELINFNINLYQATASEKEIRLVQESDQNVYAWADYQSVNTVIRNLLSNSIKFSYPKSTIYIHAAQHEDFVEVSVIDQGVGMSEDVLNSIFSIDKKQSQKGTRNETGSGFGLTLCHELIHQNQGQLRVNSKLQEGSTFSFSLPLYKKKGDKIIK